MWIETQTDKSGNQVYKFNERYVDPKTGKRKKVSITYKNKSRETQKTAWLELTKRIDERLDEKVLQRPGMTFGELIGEWLPIYKQQVKESTYYPTKNMVGTIKKRLPENYILSGIRTVDLNNMFETMLYKENLSNKYVRILKSKLNLLFSFAVKKGYIEKNPIAEVVIDYKRETNPVKIKDKFLEDDEYNQLITYTKANNKRYALLFQWLYLTGMRPGEATALHKEDVHIKDGVATVSINGTMMYHSRTIKNMKKSTSTKTAAGMREISLPKKAVIIYEELLQLNPEGHFLFQTGNGTPFVLRAINQFLYTYKRKMNIEKKLSSHIFRHTHISKLAELGTPLYAIQDRVGHEKSDITEKIYLHVTKGVKEKLKEDIEKL